MPKHLDELKLFMKEISFDILCINETRLDNTINDNIIKIPGYDIIRRDRDRNGGGVAIYIRSTINYKNHVEFIPIQIMLGKYGKLFFLMLQIYMLHFGFVKSKVNSVLG